MLEEIRQKDVVEETISPVFCIQLVLNVPGAEKPREERKRHRRHKTSSPDKSGYFSLGKSDSASTRKTVQFQDMEEASGHFIGHVTGFCIDCSFSIFFSTTIIEIFKFNEGINSFSFFRV